MNNLCLSSLNVNSLTQQKFKTIKKKMEEMHILALLDTRVHPSQHRNYKIQQIGSHLNPNTTTGKKGIMILYRQYLNPTFKDIMPGQLTEMRFMHANMEFQVYFIYGPSHKDDPAFFNQLEPSINLEIPVIIISDTLKMKSKTSKTYQIAFHTMTRP